MMDKMKKLIRNKIYKNRTDYQSDLDLVFKKKFRV